MEGGGGIDGALLWVEWFCIGLCTRIVAGQGGKQHRIAYLSGYSDEIDKPLFSAFVRGLGDFGYVEGRNIAIDRRYAGGTPEAVGRARGRARPAETRCFVVGAGAAATERRAVSGNTPIVMANVQDPVARAAW